MHDSIALSVTVLPSSDFLQVPRIFGSFAKETRKRGHRSSLTAEKRSAQDRKFAIIRFLTIKNPNNHGGLQRRRRPASSSGCVRGKFPASNPPLSLRHCAEPPSRRQVQNFPRVNGSEPRTSFWRTMCFSGFAAWRPSLHPSDAMQLNIC